MKSMAKRVIFMAMGLALTGLTGHLGCGGSNNNNGGGNNPPPNQPLTLNFAAVQIYPANNAGTNSQAIAIGDIDGDGFNDVAVANENDLGGNDVSVFLNKGDGTLLPKSDFQSGAATAVNSLVLGDFDGNGKLDLAASNDNQAVVFLNDGSVNLFGAPSAPISLGGFSGSLAITKGDVDGQKGLDLITTGSNNIVVLYNDGTGTFGGSVQGFNGGGSLIGLAPRGVVAADFNGGGVDVATADFAPDGGGKFNATFLPNDGTGDFNNIPGTNFPISTTNPNQGIAAGDFNGDGKVDIVVSNLDDKAVAVLLNDGAGSFKSSVNYPSGFDSSSVAVADFDLDGKLDITVANSFGQDAVQGDVTVLLGKGDGTFQDEKIFSAGQVGATPCNPRSIAVGDLNNDGKPDMATLGNMTNTVGVYLNTSQ